MSKEGVIARLPLYHEVFDGNTAEVHTPWDHEVESRLEVERKMLEQRVNAQGA